MSATTEKPKKTTIFIPGDVRDWLLTQIPISTRLERVLCSMGCNTLGDLHGLDYDQILSRHACGRKTIEELESFIDSLQSDASESPAAEAGRNDREEPNLSYISIPRKARGWSLAQLPMSTRLANILRDMGFQLLGDLHGVTIDQVRSAYHCGNQTIAELEALVGRVRSGEFDYSGTGVEGSDAAYLVVLVDRALEELWKLERDMLVLRLYGTGGEPMTLEEIGSKHGFTREGVRQAVNRTLNCICRNGGPPFVEALRKLADKCLKAICPLTPELLLQWIGPEAQRCRYPASFYVCLFNEMLPDIPTWPDNPVLVDKKRAAQIAFHLKRLLQENTSPLLLREAFEQLKAEGKLSALNPREFLSVVSRRSFLKVEFISPDQPVILPLKIRTRRWIQLILSQAEHPLRPEEIIERGREMFGDNFPALSPATFVNALHNKVLDCADNFYLLDHGAYGLRQHIRLPERMWDKVRSDIYQLLQDEKRPISTIEIVNEKKLDWGVAANAYELAQILREDTRFIDLGRLLFALAEWGIQEREQVNDLVLKVLTQAGHPMAANQIRSELRRLRSVGDSVIFPALRSHQRVSHYGFGYYGLKSWGDAAKSFLVSDPVFVNRVVVQCEPPLTFGGLCRLLKISPKGRLAGDLWRTIQSLDKVKARPNKQTPKTFLSYKPRKLQQAVYFILAEANRPLGLHDIRTELVKLNDRFGSAFGQGRYAAELERRLRQSRFFTCNVSGEFSLATRFKPRG